MADDLDDEWWIDNKTKDVESDMEQETESKVVESSNVQTKKKKKRNRKKKNITAELNEKGDIAARPDDVADYIRKQFEGKLTPVEIDEVTLDKEKHFFKADGDHKFAVAYFKSILPKWKKLQKNLSSPGSPLVLIISSAAMRSVNLNREIAEFKGEGCKCAKLFAKHMKKECVIQSILVALKPGGSLIQELEDQQKFLQKTVCHIALGTPNRVIALLKSGHLKLDKLSALVLDWNWRDVKKRRLMDVPETRQEMLTLLQSHLIPIVKSEQRCKIGIL